MINPAEVSEGIDRVINELEDLAGEIRQVSNEAAYAEASFKAEFAKARIAARYKAQVAGDRLTTDAAEDIATVATEDLRLTHLLKSHGLTAAREALRAAESRMDGYRTQSASIRIAAG